MGRRDHRGLSGMQGELLYDGGGVGGVECRRTNMKIGTRSVLFGVHAFWFHPIVVALGWRLIHGRWPRDRAEWFSIIFHDAGYWGMPNMDGLEGQWHPVVGAAIVYSMLADSHYQQCKAVNLILGHSREFCMKTKRSVSALCAPDKVSVLFEPRWFYILRGTLSGEITEFIINAPAEFQTGRFKAWRWFNWYRAKVRRQFTPSSSQSQFSNTEW